MYPNLNLSAQTEVNRHIILVCSVDYILGDIQTPIIIKSYEGGRRVIICVPYIDGIEIWYSLYDNFHSI